MNKITFGRTQSWSSGWRGKQNVTDVFVDSFKVGEIKGREDSSVHSMNYDLLVLNTRDSAFSLKEAKALARRIIDTSVMVPRP